MAGHISMRTMIGHFSKVVKINVSYITNCSIHQKTAGPCTIGVSFQFPVETYQSCGKCSCFGTWLILLCYFMANTSVHRTDPHLLLNYNAKCGLQFLLPLHCDNCQSYLQTTQAQHVTFLFHHLSFTAWRTTPSPSKASPRHSASWSPPVSSEILLLLAYVLISMPNLIVIPLERNVSPFCFESSDQYIAALNVNLAT